MEDREAFARGGVPFWFCKFDLGVLFALASKLTYNACNVFGVVYIVVIDHAYCVTFESAFPVADVFMSYGAWYAAYE